MVGVRDNCVRAYARVKSCMRMYWRTFHARFMALTGIRTGRQMEP